MLIIIPLSNKWKTDDIDADRLYQNFQFSNDGKDDYVTVEFNDGIRVEYQFIYEYDVLIKRPNIDYQKIIRQYASKNIRNTAKTINSDISDEKLTHMVIDNFVQDISEYGIIIKKFVIVES